MESYINIKFEQIYGSSCFIWYASILCTAVVKFMSNSEQNYPPRLKSFSYRNVGSLSSVTMVQESLNVQHIEESMSPCNSPIFVNKNKFGKQRMVTYLRATKVIQDMGSLSLRIPLPSLLPEVCIIILLFRLFCLTYIRSKFTLIFRFLFYKWINPSGFTASYTQQCSSVRGTQTEVKGEIVAPVNGISFTVLPR